MKKKNVGFYFMQAMWNYYVYILCDSEGGKFKVIMHFLFYKDKYIFFIQKIKTNKSINVIIEKLQAGRNCIKHISGKKRIENRWQEKTDWKEGTEN